MARSVSSMIEPINQGGGPSAGHAPGSWRTCERKGPCTLTWNATSEDIGWRKQPQSRYVQPIYRAAPLRRANAIVLSQTGIWFAYLWSWLNAENDLMKIAQPSEKPGVASNSTIEHSVEPRALAQNLDTIPVVDSRLEILVPHRLLARARGQTTDDVALE